MINLKNKKTYIITGNPNKAKNAIEILDTVLDNVAHYSLDLPEIQSLNLKEVVANKLQFALDNFKSGTLEQAYLIVEDISLEFEAMGKLPGTFIKFFCSELGLEKMCKMLNALDDANNRKATIKCVIGIAKLGEKNIDNAIFLESQLKGAISDAPRGNNGFGFDKIFKPEIFNNKTAGELTNIEYKKYFATIRNYQRLVKL